MPNIDLIGVLSIGVLWLTLLLCKNLEEEVSSNDPLFFIRLPLIFIRGACLALYLIPISCVFLNPLVNFFLGERTPENPSKINLLDFFCISKGHLKDLSSRGTSLSEVLGGVLTLYNIILKSIYLLLGDLLSLLNPMFKVLWPSLHLQIN